MSCVVVREMSAATPTIKQHRKKALVQDPMDSVSKHCQSNAQRRYLVALTLYNTGSQVQRHFGT